MKIVFNGKEYAKNGRNGTALKNLCFDIFKNYLELNSGLSYEQLQETFNKWHCRNNYVVLSKSDWENKTEDLKQRYFEPVFYNNQEIYFTTQWGNNGGDCDNVNKMIDFAIAQKYDIKILEDEISVTKTLQFGQRNSMNIKNIILYGPPGVGKTYNYQKLISLIEEGKTKKEIFDSISKNDKTEQDNNDIYNAVKNECRVEFVTFHQSYSYEDFIEGFRPNDNGDIKLEDGIFKNISDNANKNLEASKKDVKEISKEKLFKNKLEAFKENLETAIEKDGYYPITEAAYLTSADIDAFRYNIRRENPTYKYDLRMKFEDLYKFNENDVTTRQDIKGLSNINPLANQHASYFFKVFDEINNIDVEVEIIKEVELKNHYIIIDEINRGNISKIFGELITLIEEDKRDSYSVTLPYSKQSFKVPSNLYIIATMNSTDKSIATIDIALRRRFTFLKMQPKEELIEYADAKKVFNDINKLIKEHLNEDYMLGHSYFMKVKDADDLEFVKKYKIKPLLEEYFYADEVNYDKAIEILKLKEENE